MVTLTNYSSGSNAFDNVLLTFLGLLAVFTTTYAYTESRFWLQSRGKAGRFQGREPLTLPYTIPWVGGGFRLLNPHAMYEYARPVRLRVGPVGIYVLFGDKNIRTIFKNSKVLSKLASSMMLLRNSGMPEHDVKIMASDTSGTGITPMTSVPDEKRVWKKTHETGVKHLSSGSSVTILTTKFMDFFVEELDIEQKGQSFTVPLFDYLKKAMFRGSMTSVAGTDFFKLNPGLREIYWNYDDTFLLTAIGMPKLVYRKGHVARDQMLEATVKWLKDAWTKYDDIDENVEWEESFGSKFVRYLVLDLKNSGLSTEGQAACMLPMIWAINSNAIPCAVWVIFEALQHQGLFRRLRDEISATAFKDENGELKIDVPKLISQCPLLQSVYLECLRVRSSNTIMRQITEDLEVDGYILKKGVNIMSPSWLPSHGPLWDVPGHPAHSFWPERFIEMPKLAPENPDEKSQYELAMKPDNFFPYGGGNAICTGRFFAKQEILVAAAILIMKFDIEPQGWIHHNGKKSDRIAKVDEGYAGAGILPPDRDLMVKLRRIA